MSQTLVALLLSLVFLMPTPVFAYTGGRVTDFARRYDYELGSYYADSSKKMQSFADDQAIACNGTKYNHVHHWQPPRSERFYEVPARLIWGFLPRFMGGGFIDRERYQEDLGPTDVGFEECLAEKMRGLDEELGQPVNWGEYFAYTLLGLAIVGTTGCGVYCGYRFYPRCK